MKRFGLFVAMTLGVAFVATLAFAQPIDSGGLKFVNHDASMSGSGTVGSPLKVNTSNILPATAVTGTAPDLAVFTGTHAIGNYAGSSPAACSAGNALTREIIDATGSLAATCSQFVNGTGTTSDLMAWSSSGTATNYAGSSPSGCGTGAAVTGETLSASGALFQSCTTIASGTTSDLAAFTSAGAVGNYAGSSPSACSSGNAVTDAALSAAGVLSLTCAQFLTTTNVSGTANDVAIFTGTNTVGNAPGISYDGSTTYTISKNTAITAIALLKKFNYSPINAAGDLNSTNFEQQLHNLTGIGQATFSMLQFGASDNTGSVITGIDASSASVGDIAIICNHNAPTDDGTLVLSSEDGNSSAANQIKTPGTGRTDDAVPDHFTIQNGACDILFYSTPNANSGDTTTKQWMTIGSQVRTTRQITQLRQLFPAYDTAHMTGTVVDFGGPYQSDINQSNAVPGPKNGSSTSVGQNTTVASASNGHTLPQATIDVASTARFTTSGKGSTTIASASNGHTLPQATIDVASTTSFWQNATLYFVFITNNAGAVQKIQCTGITGGNQLTGCSGGSGVLGTGNAVVGTYYSVAIQATLNTFLDYYYVQCTGLSGGNQLTGCVGGKGVINTGNAVVNNPICEAGGSCFELDYSIVRWSNKDSTGATLSGIYWPTNAYPQGLGPEKKIINYGPGPLYITNQDSNSASSNQIQTSTGGTLIINVNEAVTLWHYSTDTYWHAMAHTGHGELIAFQKFTASGTYTPSIGTNAIVMEMCAQGGGGGGAQGTGGDAAAGGGGGAGEYGRVRIVCGGACTTTSSNVTIANSGGAGGLGDATHGNDGTDGSSTSIVITGPSSGTVTYSVAGGVHGHGMLSQTGAAIALGGQQSATAGNMDVETRGGVGENGVIITTSCGAGKCGYGGNGADSVYGAGGKGFDVVSAGQSNGFGFCSGGSGGSTEYGTGFSGGNAGGGLILVYEYN